MPFPKELKPILLKNIEASYWKEPTPIQMQAIPILLSSCDILAAAPTGSGKTASYVIPTLCKLSQPLQSLQQPSKKNKAERNDNANNNSNSGKGIRALLLAPTKELADQIYRETIRLAEGKKFKICNLKKNLITQAKSDAVGSVIINTCFNSTVNLI
jgi:ATP-dependent RNA helicase DDX52/ROK1